MDQIKVVNNKEIKRSTLPDNYSDLVNRITGMFDLRERFSLHYLNEKGEREIVNEASFEKLKEKVKQSQTSLKLYVGPEEIDYSFNQSEKKEECLPDNILTKIHENFERNYNKMRNYYEKSELVGKIRKGTENFFNKIQNSFFPIVEQAIFFKNAPENSNEDTYLQDLRDIRANFLIEKSDNEILTALRSNKGDLDKSLSSLFA